MSLTDAPHDLFKSPPKRALLFFGLSAVMCAIAMWTSGGTPRSAWFFPYALFFCFVGASTGFHYFLGARGKPITREPWIFIPPTAGMLVSVVTQLLVRRI